MSRRLVVLPRAKLQMYDAAIWWADNRSLDEAARWLDSIESAIQSLRDDADRFPLAPESPALDFPLRQMVFGLSRRQTHRVLFALQEDRVVVYAVRHLAQRELPPEDLG